MKKSNKLNYERSLHFLLRYWILIPRDKKKEKKNQYKNKNIKTFFINI